MSTQTEVNSSRIEIHGLVKRYQYQVVLDHLSLTIEDGTFCVLVGANGAGKTTLLRILATLVRPDNGKFSIGGIPMTHSRNFRHKIGYLSHQPMFYLDLTAVENLRHYARLYRLSNMEDRINSTIQSVELTQHQHKQVRFYSRGMQQRLSIARALLHDPDILLLDEPYTGLDQEAAQFLDKKLHTLSQPGRTILLAAHRPQRLLPIATHIAWLNDGKISTHLAVDHLTESPELQHYLQEIT